jgi:hypothetical protein
MRTELIENTPAQRDSKFSNGRLSGLFCWPQGQDINNSVQYGSKFSKLVAEIMRVMRVMGIMGRKSGIENHPVEPHSKFSKWGGGVLRSLGILGWKTKTENSSAQPHTKFSKLHRKPFLHYLNELHGEEMLSA